MTSKEENFNLAYQMPPRNEMKCQAKFSTEEVSIMQCIRAGAPKIRLNLSRATCTGLLHEGHCLTTHQIRQQMERPLPEHFSHITI